MKVIKQFYSHKTKLTYKVGDNYDGVDFKGSKDYLEQPKAKTKKTKK